MNPKQKIFIIAGIIFIFITLLIFLIAKPMFFEIVKVSATVSQSRDRLLLIENTDQNYFQQIESDYNEISENIAVVQNGLIDNNQAVEFFMDLEKIASLTFNELEINAGNFPVLDLTLVGSFPDLMRFLGWLEEGKYFLGIESIDSRQVSVKEPEENPSNDLKTNIRIKVYTKK